MSFARIAYEALDVCNGVEMAQVMAMVLKTGLPPGARAIDVGTGNAAVAIETARRFGLNVTAIELSPDLADLARRRISASGLPVRLIEGPAHEHLMETDPVDLITALGVTNVTGTGRPEPAEAFAFLRRRLTPGGWLLWGDLTWRSEPAGPLRQLAESANLYADEAGWVHAARTAGLSVVAVEQTPQDVFDAYSARASSVVDDWLAAHPDAPEHASIRFNAERLKAMFDFGRGVVGFGMYLLRAPA